MKSLSGETAEGKSDAKPIYKAVFERDDNDTWFVRVPEVQGAHSFGGTLVRADRNIQEALALVLDVEEDSFELEREVRLAPDARAAVVEAQRYREIATLSQDMSSIARARAVNVLSSGASPLSLRDIGELVGTSFQRIQQIRANEPLREAAEANGDKEGAADVVNLMAVLNTSVEAARLTQHGSALGRPDLSEVWSALSQPIEASAEGDVTNFIDALRTCIDAVRRNVQMIPWSVGVVAKDDA